MPPKRSPAPHEIDAFLDDAFRDNRSLERYAMLYPSLRTRLLALLHSNSPPIREKVAALKKAFAEKAKGGEVWFQKRYGLTPTEARIALFIAEGGSVAAFAERAGISPGTVRTHLKAIFEKTGVSRQASLAALLRTRSVRASR